MINNVFFRATCLHILIVETCFFRMGMTRKWTVQRYTLRMCESKKFLFSIPYHCESHLWACMRTGPSLKSGATDLSNSAHTAVTKWDCPCIAEVDWIEVHWEHWLLNSCKRTAFSMCRAHGILYYYFNLFILCCRFIIILMYLFCDKKICHSTQLGVTDWIQGKTPV